MKDNVRRLREDINEYCGYDLRGYDIDFSINAVKREMSYRDISSFSQFSKSILSDELLLDSFIKRHFISVSDMFRDIEPFRIFREQVIPDLKSYPRIRIWSCGCASGKEVLSLAIILQEEGLYDRTNFYATDINKKALDEAASATFSLKEIIGFTQNYYLSGGREDFRKYYTVNWKNNTVQFKKSLLENIYFSVHNITSDKSINEFEVIFCRNVFIYFTHSMQKKTLELVEKSLRKLGYLFLGHSEHIDYKHINEKIAPVDKINKVYKKIA
jgi:chemotaxis protein methyltransferase CheR